MSSMYKALLFEVKDNIARITFNRPESYNAFNNEMHFEFLDALEKCRDDEEVRCIVISGEGKAFNAGQDLKDVGSGPGTFETAVETRYNPMTRLLTGIEKPIIARLNGVAAGAGASIALACDYVVAADHVKMLWAFVNIGLVLDSGSSYFLPRLVGRRKAFELACLGNKITAQEAYDLGIINEVVPADQLDEATDKIATRFANSATQAIGMMKRMLNQSFESTLEEILEMEKVNQETAGNSEDYEEGVASFKEKRKPVFKGK